MGHLLGGLGEVINRILLAPEVVLLFCCSPDILVEDDPALIEQARCDPDAFATLYRRYLTPVYRYLYSRWEAFTKLRKFQPWSSRNARRAGSATAMVAVLSSSYYEINKMSLRLCLGWGICHCHCVGNTDS